MRWKWLEPRWNSEDETFNLGFVFVLLSQLALSSELKTFPHLFQIVIPKENSHIDLISTEFLSFPVFPTQFVSEEVVRVKSILFLIVTQLTWKMRHQTNQSFQTQPVGIRIRGKSLIQVIPSIDWYMWTWLIDNKQLSPDV